MAYNYETPFSIFWILIQLTLLVSMLFLLWDNYRFYSNMVENQDEPLNLDVAKSLRSLYLMIFIINVTVLAIAGGLALYYVPRLF